MYEMVEWSPSLNLEEFYAEAASRGHINNSSQKVMVDCFRNEERSQVWILYKNNCAIGSVAAHKFPEMGENSFRILCRTCVFTDELPIIRLRTKTGIMEHQNITCQFFIPKMIEWCGIESNMYATSNQLDGGSQRKVHKIYFPLLEKQGEFARITEIPYRGTEQTVWKLNPYKFNENLSKYPRWI